MSKKILLTNLFFLIIACFTLAGCQKEVTLQDITVNGTDTTLAMSAPFNLSTVQAPAPPSNEKDFIKATTALEGHDSNIQIMTIAMAYDPDKYQQLNHKKFEPTLEAHATLLERMIRKNYSGSSSVNITDSNSELPGKILSFTYKSKSDTQLSTKILYFYKNNELWAVEISVKDGDKDAQALAEKIINSIH